MKRLQQRQYVYVTYMRILFTFTHAHTPPTSALKFASHVRHAQPRVSLPYKLQHFHEQTSLARALACTAHCYCPYV